MTRRDRGMVTAELAVTLPAVVLVLGMGLAAISAGIDQIRCVDAARAGARSAARGDSIATVRAAAVAAAPAGAVVTVGSGGAVGAAGDGGGGGTVRVVVEARAGGWGGVLPSWSLRAEATGPVESGAAP
ncbi:MAG: hypothetical protein JWP82_2601 [Humibacillus sp.]|nr:hypothetical protein [Humibacillus sp.]